MLVHVDPTGLHSPAMVRIAKALTTYAPSDITIVKRRDEADLQVLYVISVDAVATCASFLKHGTHYAIVQCCVGTTGLKFNIDWVPTWQGADLVMSYYDLRLASAEYKFPFYHAPLGVDPVFAYGPHHTREHVVTTGHVHGPGAEEIEAVWVAAERCGMTVAHVGPKTVKGISKTYPHVKFVGEVSDPILADLYRSARYVAALRYIEGFELPAAEALVGGTRPILFKQPVTHYWYGDLARYIDEDLTGDDLVTALVQILNQSAPVTAQERERAAAIFNWRRIATDFWRRITQTDRGKTCE